MKKIYKTLSLIALLVLVHSQMATAAFVVIPDANFRAFLKATFPSCFNFDGFMDTECSEIKSATKITVYYKQIESLEGIQYFTSLTYLDCGRNSLTTLLDLPSNLKTIYCSYNQLTSLPTLPTNLIKLECYSNKLTSLPSLPPSLIELNCTWNQLTNLPSLPSKLEVLSCRNNQLTSLASSGIRVPGKPVLPLSLTRIECSYNKLSSLPTLPNSLFELSANNNCFTTTPVNSNPSVLKEFTVSPNRTDCNTTAVSQPTYISAFNIFPNPTEDKVYISSTRAITKIEIYNYFGVKITSLAPEEASEFSMKEYAAGIYFLKITSDDVVTTEKIVKK